MTDEDKKLPPELFPPEMLSVELTPELLKNISQALSARREDIDERYPALVAECPYETRLAVTAWVMRALVEHATEGGSFRYLIYDRLGFDIDAYVPLYTAGGMTISNEFELPSPSSSPLPDGDDDGEGVE